MNYREENTKSIKANSPWLWNNSTNKYLGFSLALDDKWIYKREFLEIYTNMSDRFINTTFPLERMKEKKINQ